MDRDPKPETTAQARTTRLAHLRQESTIKSVGQLCYLVAFFSVLGTLEFVLFAIGLIPRTDLKIALPDSLLDAFFWSMTVVFTINTLAQIALGYGLIRLQSWARWTVVVLTILSLGLGTLSSLGLCFSDLTLQEFEPLIGFPLQSRMVGLASLIVGGVFHLLILWPLISPGSGLVFSTAYQTVIQETPEIKSRMHWLLKICLGLLLILVVGFIAFLMAIYFRIID